jgi:hypothetical protein
MLENVCGQAALKTVFIVTTRWDVVGNKKAVELEQELVTGEQYFKPLCDAGASTFGHDNTRLSAWRVMYKLLINYSPIVFRIQEELEAGMTLEQTAAGSQLSTDLEAIIKKHGAEIKKLHEEMGEAAKARDEGWQKELNGELAKLKGDMIIAAKSKEYLNRRSYQPYVPVFFDSYKTSLNRFSESLNPNATPNVSERLVPGPPSPGAEGATGGQSGLASTIGGVGGSFFAGAFRGLRS